MSGLVVTKMHHLAGEFEDLKGRLRIALAGELARHVATAVGDVIRAVVAGDAVPGVSRARMNPHNPDADPWDEDEEEYDSSYGYRPPRDAESEEVEADPPVGVNASVAIAASVHVARWWLLGRRGTVLGAVGAGFGIGLIGIVGGPLARSVLVILAAAGDLLSVSESIGSGAARLKQI